VQELVRLGDLEALRVFAKASNELTMGEMRQLSALDALAFSEDDYEFLIRAKTAALFSASCEVGALCGASAHRDQLANYGAHLGMAFQVVDDLLDYTGAAETVGKPTGLDLREHKVTLPLIAALRSLSPAARAVVNDLFARSDPTDEQIAEVIGIVRDEGGLEYARRRGDEYAVRAEEELAGLPDTPARAALHETLTYVMDRRS
jgi:octaprenyl-diphosphate synthase